MEQAFDAELYILMLTYEDEAGADAAVDDWVEHAASLYVLDDQITEEHNGVEYTLVTYTFGEDADTPYACGASAFAAFGKYGVTLELICADTFAEDPLTVLRAALDGCHVNAALAG